jgi:hypothetical protein
MHRLVGCLLVLSLGCGLTQVKGPAPHRAPTERPDCTTSEQPIKIDGAFGAVGVLFTLLGLGLSQSDTDSDVPVIMLVGGLTTTVAMLVSSGVGYSKIKKCNAAFEDYNRRTQQPPSYPAQPQPYPALPQPYPAQPRPYPAQPQPQPYPAQPQPYPPEQP